ncbi:AAA family ATPase [Streptacidiphilus jiangxiensis]|uniref:Regulatory protein, luxR family n=1 Tax=Streptacidiphilus jiangxiensis TaxID=235985 RepID=A0A1H7WH74_STRJI|nr:AAA family ATPase [Streptacidiphilus jiangxiensis]SEM20409.1 regulatory protein, luxR family [Streptacidiphilus jiangxiensis]
MESLTTRLVGRESERSVLASFLASPQGQALVLKGETGVGKSALLDQLSGQAAEAGCRVLRAAGVEAESNLPFAGLHQLLFPLLPHAERLDRAHRAVFDVVFGHGRDQAPSVMALGIAVLDLMTVAASHEQLLLVLDDGQWLDAASTEVCGFVGRRLGGNGVKLVVALRPEQSSGFDTAALPVLPVPPLSKDAAARLLDARHPHVDPHVRSVTLDQAQGNPLALVELPPYLAVQDLQGPGGHLEARLVPLPDRFRQVYGARITALAPESRAELLRGALDGVHAGAVAAPLRTVRYRMRGVDEAAAVGLLDLDAVSGEYVFRHPLVRSTVVRSATPNERRAAHAVLAQVHRDDVERRATHLAAATVDPDEEVAAALEVAAASATRRGGAAAALTWLTRAAELSPDPADRSRRLGDAAFVAGFAGLLDQAQRLADTEDLPGGSGSPAAVVAFAYGALYQDGDVRSSHRQVAAAVERIRDRGSAEPSPELTRLLNLLVAVSQFAGDRASWQRTHHLLDSLGDVVPSETRIYQDAWCDVVRRGAGVGERVAEAFAAFPNLDPWDVTRLGVAAYHVDTLHHYRAHLVRSVERELRTGAVGAAMTMLHLIMLDQIGSGEWDAAEQTGQRVLELTQAHGHVLFVHQSHAYLGLVAALRGDVDRARDLRAVVERWARPRGIGFLIQIAEAVAATAALGAGDYETAYLHASRITAPESFEPCSHQAARTLLDLVEAALHTGRTEIARRHALAAQAAGLPELSPRLALVTFGALSMTAGDDEEAVEMFRRAEAHPAAVDFPFELARIRLAHGVRLRHGPGPKSARPVLSEAAETFQRLGAAGWVGRALAELRACGGAAAATAASPTANVGALTWQERRIADLAASGLTNKEIGERTHLSPRTVSSHLYRVFPKLGVTSRAALRDALAAAPGATGPDSSNRR